MFTRTNHWPLSWARQIQPTPSYPISLSYILISSSHLRLGLPRGLFPSSFPTKILFAFLISPTPRPSHLPWLDHPNIHFPLPRSFQRIRSIPKPCVTFRNKLVFYGEELLGPHPTPKLEDYPLSAVRDCLFNVFAATLHSWRPFPPSATWGRAMP